MELGELYQLVLLLVLVGMILGVGIFSIANRLGEAVSHLGQVCDQLGGDYK